jgi:hypothetical protein
MNLNLIEKTELSNIILTSLYISNIVEKEDFKSSLYFFLSRYGLNDFEKYIENFVNNSLKSARKRIEKIDGRYLKISSEKGFEIQKETSTWLNYTPKKTNSTQQRDHNRLFFIAGLELNLIISELIKEGKQVSLNVNKSWENNIEPDLLLNVGGYTLAIELDSNTRPAQEVNNQIDSYINFYKNKLDFDFIFLGQNSRPETMKKKFAKEGVNNFYSFQINDTKHYSQLISHLIQSSNLSAKTDLTIDQNSIGFPDLEKEISIKQFETLVREL